MSVDKNMQILIVDDYKTMLKIVRNLLGQLGFNNIDEATDGKMALEKLGDSEKNFKLIISDWNMEPMSGLELLKQVRVHEKYKAVPFIMVTAESKTENVIVAKKAGVNNYIIKPFNAQTLKDKMTAVLGAFNRGFFDRLFPLIAGFPSQLDLVLSDSRILGGVRCRT